MAANLKVIDRDIGQRHTCQGLGQDKDRLILQTEVNGNISLYVIGNKFKLDYETTKQFTGRNSKSQKLK